MLDITKLSSRYRVRRMSDADAEEILAFCRENTLFYEYCQAQPTGEQVLRDLRVTPPGVGPSAKYYLGFFDGDMLAAVLDLIEGYPDEKSCFIGFFMMNARLQGRQLGSALIGELCARLKEHGFAAVRLGIDKGNPQSTHFWKKNGFRVVKEVEREGWTVLVAEKTL